MLLPAALALDGAAGVVAGHLGLDRRVGRRPDEQGRLVLVKEVDGLFAQWPAQGRSDRSDDSRRARRAGAYWSRRAPAHAARTGKLRDVGDQRSRPRAPRRAARTRRDGGHPNRLSALATVAPWMRSSARNTRPATVADPTLRDYKLVGGLETFANRSFWPSFFSRVAARQAVGHGGHRLRPRHPRMGGAAGRAPPAPHDAPRRLPRGARTRSPSSSRRSSQRRTGRGPWPPRRA